MYFFGVFRVMSVCFSFDPGTKFFENMIFMTISRDFEFRIWSHNWTQEPNGHFAALDFAPRAVLRSSTLCLYYVFFNRTASN